MWHRLHTCLSYIVIYRSYIFYSFFTLANYDAYYYVFSVCENIMEKESWGGWNVKIYFLLNDKLMLYDFSEKKGEREEK